MAKIIGIDLGTTNSAVAISIFAKSQVTNFYHRDVVEIYDYFPSKRVGFSEPLKKFNVHDLLE
jgi:hypothetical protein